VRKAVVRLPETNCVGQAIKRQSWVLWGGSGGKAAGGGQLFASMSEKVGGSERKRKMVAGRAAQVRVKETEHGAGDQGRKKKQILEDRGYRKREKKKAQTAKTVVAI